MLRLSELSGFLVGGNRFEKICGKISPENRNRKPLLNQTMGRGDLGSGCVRTEYITLKSLPITAKYMQITRLNK